MFWKLIKLDIYDKTLSKYIYYSILIKVYSVYDNKVINLYIYYKDNIVRFIHARFRQIGAFVKLMSVL